MALRCWLIPRLTILVLVVLVMLIAVLVVPATGLPMSFEHCVHFVPSVGSHSRAASGPMLGRPVELPR